MRRITLWLLSTVTVLVLLFSYRTSTSSTAEAARGGASVHHQDGTGSAVPATSTPGPDSSAGATGDSSSSASSPSPSHSSSGTSGTFTGDPADTRWGTIQVRITVQDGRITASETVQQPSGNPRDEEINATAVPVYNQETIAAQSTRIDAVSGATVTWQGYTQSLQSAIDQAHL